jgi:ectoine hydroxylase-related dioxygenase (phytanoyl-CoA dioxygenase family)
MNNITSVTVDSIYVNLFLENLSISNYNMNTYLTFDNCDLSKIVNYYNTFGFLKIDNFFISINENIIKAYSFNVLHNALHLNNYIPRAMEHLTYFSNIIINKKIHKLLEKLFNSSYVYAGSDSKIYDSDTNWHCDRKTKNHYLKCCFYLDNLNENTGCLRVLPGSQNSKDIYNNILSKKSIPLFLGPGGFDSSFLNSESIPYYPINISFGDFVIFNLALYHSAFGNHINKKMICMNFYESYTDNNDPEKLETIDTDFSIIGSLSKNLDLSKNIIPYHENFYKYVRHNDHMYTTMFKEHIENNNSLDKYIRVMLNNNCDKTELNELINNSNNTNIKKTNIDIVVNNSKI